MGLFVEEQAPQTSYQNPILCSKVICWWLCCEPNSSLCCTEVESWSQHSILTPRNFPRIKKIQHFPLMAKQQLCTSRSPHTTAWLECRVALQSPVPSSLAKISVYSASCFTGCFPERVVVLLYFFSLASKKPKSPCRFLIYLLLFVSHGHIAWSSHNLVSDQTRQASLGIIKCAQHYLGRKSKWKRQIPAPKEFTISSLAREGGRKAEEMQKSKKR